MNPDLPATTTAGQLTTPEAKQWALFIHLSQLAGWFVPVLGWAVPIILWQMKKNELPELDAHGKVVTNWLIAQFVYGVVGAVLSVVLIGIPLLLVLLLLGVIFPVIGALKSQKGELWKYPLSFPILK